MNFLQEMLRTTKNDEFQIESSISGIKKLSDQLESEKTKLESVKNAASGAALAGDEVDELSIIRQEKRISVFEDALEKALSEASIRLQGQMPEIKKSIDSLEKEKNRLNEQRDKEYLKSVVEFLTKTGGELADMPRRGHGGVIRIPATFALELEQVQKVIGTLPAAGSPAPTPIFKKIAGVRERLEKLTTLQHYGPKKGLQTLIG